MSSQELNEAAVTWREEVRHLEITVSVVQGGLAFAQLRPAWTELLEASGQSVFNSWEWLYPWYRCIAPDRSLFLLTARSGEGSLVGLWPLAIEVRKVFGRPVRRLAFLGETHVGSDFLDIIVQPENRQAVTRAFIQILKARRAEWDVLDLVDFRAESPTVGLLEHAFATEISELSERYVCPFETFAAGERFDDFLRRTGRRDNYLRRRKWLEKQPGFAIELDTRPGSLAQPMSEFFRLHHARWAGDGGSQGIKGARVEAFHRHATELLATRGWLRMYTMKVQGAAVASVYGILQGGSFSYFQSGYDPAWRNKSVGLVLVGKTLEDSLASGAQRYEFLRGTEPYKFDWVSQQATTVALRIYSKGTRGAWLTRSEVWARRLRNGVKALMPKRLEERVRRLRRKGLALH